jgi:class 3 adenylate cyclase
VPTCPSCGKEVAGEFPFCPFCAAPLKDQLATAVPEERKVVTVLFCDLVDFTAESEQQDPEDVRARLRPYHARLREEISRFGGTVEKFIGDAVMAVFGAPLAHEDDAERAVRAALSILDAIGELNDADPGLDLKVRVGIHTGEAVVAGGASAERGEGLVTGDVVNTANRIESVAPVNGVAVSEQTYRTTSHIFEYDTLEPVLVKGKAEPLALRQAKAVRIRFGTDFHEHVTPFVGRDLEKPLLIGIFERALQRRSVQLVTIVGEPGVGKSRMVAELFAYMDAKPEIIRWRQGRCLPYGEGITFWALGEIVKREAAILESDSADVALQKLEAALSPDEPERQWLLQRLAPLVGAEAGAPAERQESFTAWRRYLESLAARRETVLVFEDLHWADEALLAFLEHLAEWAGEVPLLILCTARPELYERRPGWGAGQRNAHTINLSPLSDEETAKLVSSLIATSVLTPDLECAILERAGGNPLYAEEFVRLLTDRGLSAQELTLPDSVQALIAARLDTLPPDRKSLLQDAAVVGKVFWASAVAAMGGLDVGQVELALHELARKELVRAARASSMEGESEYSFWHLVVRDVAYSQIPRMQRSRRHRAAAEWIEVKAGARVEDMAEVLAHHYLQALELAEASGDAAQAELVAPARRFLALAGERALGLDTAQAEIWLARALELTQEDDPERLTLIARWADAVLQGGRIREAVDVLDEALASLGESGGTEALAEALQLRSRVSTRLAEGRGVELAARAVELLERSGRPPPLVDAYSQLANAHWISGSPPDAIEAANRACELAQELGLAEPPRALGYRGMARAYAGDAEGLAEMERALEAFVEIGAGREISILQNNLAVARYPIEGPARSIAAFEAAVSFCEQRGLLEAERVLATNRPGLLAELARTEEALADAGELAVVLETSGQMADLVEVRSVEMSLHVARGEPQELEQAEWLLEAARGVSHVDISTYGRVAAALVLASDAPDDARAALREIDERPGSRSSPYYARHLATMVRTALALGDPELARRLTEAPTRRYPLDEHALCAARALLTELAGEFEEASALYAEASGRWQEFGNVPERAYALIGQGRCLRALRSAGAEEPLLESRELFASMGYKAALADTEALLGEGEAAAV